MLKSTVLFLSIVVSHALSLPALTNLDDALAMRHNHEFSATANWVVPGLILQGRNPDSGRGSSEERMRKIREEGKVTTFVCLQAEIPPQTADDSVAIPGGSEAYKEGFLMPGFTNYADEAVKFDPKPKFVHYGIRDMQTAETLDGLKVLTTDLCERIKTGQVLYLHCWGGKGRAGLVACCLLGCLYESMTSQEALQRIQAYCSMRNAGVGTQILSPETDQQKIQVRDFYFSVLDRN
jgi:hypothetical protein